MSEKEYGPWKKKFAFIETKMTVGDPVWFNTYYARRVTHYLEQAVDGVSYETVQRVANTLDMLRL